jgi:hypothetical protein
MTAFPRILVTLSLSLTFATPAFARTEEEAFNALVRAVAPDETELLDGKFKPKLACVCLSDESPGLLVSVGAPGPATPVRCLLPAFSEGVFTGGFYCAGEFVSLGR